MIVTIVMRDTALINRLRPHAARTAVAVARATLEVCMLTASRCASAKHTYRPSATHGLLQRIRTR